MSKTVEQLTETTTIDTNDVFHIVDTSAEQDKKIKASNVWSGKPYGELSLYENATATTISVATTPVLVTTGGTTTTAGLLNKFTHDAATGKLTYTGTEDVTVLVTLSLTQMSASGTVGNKVFITYNGANQTKSKKENELTATNWVSCATSILLTLSTNDYLQVQISNETSTANITVQDMNLNVTAI